MRLPQQRHKPSLLRSMMRPYESAQHAVVAFGLHHEETTFLNTGPPVCDTACADWMFEIGSITKVFTAILLCLLVEEGKIDPRAPLRDMSPALADVPDWITPERLTSHTSGLPNHYAPIWTALINPQPAGPYAEFSRHDLLDWVHRQRSPRRRPKHRYGYSNLGVGLLGEAMAMMHGTSFRDLLCQKIITPLGLKDTTDRLDAAQQDRFAAPRLPNGKRVPPWQFQSLAAAGCLRASARDLARFAQHVLKALQGPETPLDRAISRSAVPILGLGPKGAMTPTAQCAGWLFVAIGPRSNGFLFHNGGTAGSTCALHICPKRHEAFALLSNTGIAGNLWASTKHSWSKPLLQAHAYFMADGA